MAFGDRGPEWRFHRKIPHTETWPYLRNAAVPRRFERRSHVGLKIRTPESVRQPAGIVARALFIELHRGDGTNGRDFVPIQK
jgi:ribosomal protein S19E (S16A)